MVWSLVACAACADAPSASPAGPASPSAAGPSAADLGREQRVDATAVLRAYAESHALGVPRRAPSEAELVAAKIAAPPYASIDAGRWQQLPPAWRLNETYEQHQRSLWLAACAAGVERWWDAAKAIDDEMEIRLRRPVPSDFYAGMAAWGEQWAWLVKRQQGDVAFRSLAALASVGAVFRLVEAQNRWSATWGARQRPLEEALSARPLPANAWSLEDRDVEGARFCAAAEGHGPRTWPLTYSVNVIKPAGPPVGNTPIRESGTLAAIRSGGVEWLVRRRDTITRLEYLPPCHREMCKGIDCCMTPGGCWRNVCTEHEVRTYEDHAFVLHFDPLPVTSHVGDAVSFYVDATSGHAVLFSASDGRDKPPYFALGVP